MAVISLTAARASASEAMTVSVSAPRHDLVGLRIAVREHGERERQRPGGEQSLDPGAGGRHEQGLGRRVTVDVEDD